MTNSVEDDLLAARFVPSNTGFGPVARAAIGDGVDHRSSCGGDLSESSCWSRPARR